jgi:hypothetical protein
MLRLRFRSAFCVWVKGGNVDEGKECVCFKSDLLISNDFLTHNCLETFCHLCNN